MMNNPAPGQAGGMIAASLPAARQPYQPPPGTYPSQHSPPVVPDFSGGAPPPVAPATRTGVCAGHRFPDPA